MTEAPEGQTRVVNHIGVYFGMRPIITRSPKNKEPRQAIGGLPPESDAGVGQIRPQMMKRWIGLRKCEFHQLHKFKPEKTQPSHVGDHCKT